MHYLDAHPDTAVVEMDTVEGKKGAVCCLLCISEAVVFARFHS